MKELQNLSFPERLNIRNPATQREFDFPREINNACFLIPLFQSIKNIPIFSKTLRKLFLRKLGWKTKDPQIVHVIGKLADLMLEGVSKTKYSNRGSPIVNVQINKTTIPNTLIDLGDALNVITRETMEALGLTCLI